MNASDDVFSESVAVFALGALPPAEAAAVAEHVRTCARCREEYDDLRGVADLIGYQAESVPLDEVTSARMKSRIMSAVRADLSPLASKTFVRESAPAARRQPWYAYAALAAAVFLAAVVSLDDVVTHSRIADQRQTIAMLQSRSVDVGAAESSRVALQHELVQIVAPGAKRFAVPSGQVIESNGRIFIAMSGMTAPPAGKVYQAWTLARGSKSVAPSITFTPDASGDAVVELPQSAAGLAAVAVSAEPPGGSKAPTSKPAFVRALS